MSINGSKTAAGPKWKLFERLVAAIHDHVGGDADVQWDRVIDGEQFDVVVEYRYANYDHRIVVECKDYGKSKVKREQVHAFIGKARAAKANKAVMVASTGFQSGAKKLGASKGVELFTLKEIEEFHPAYLTGIFQPTLYITDVGFVGEHNVLVAHFYGEHGADPKALSGAVVVVEPDLGIPLGIYIQEMARRQGEGIGEEEKFYRVPVVGTGIISGPCIGSVFGVRFVRFTAKVVQAEVVNTGGVDPEVFRKTYQYRNELTGDVSKYAPTQLSVGIGTEFESGKFFTDPTIGFYYRCEAVDETSATLCLVESHQHGGLYQTGPFPVELKYSEKYVEVTDLDTIRRLTGLYTQLTRRLRNGT